MEQYATLNSTVVFRAQHIMYTLQMEKSPKLINTETFRAQNNSYITTDGTVFISSLLLCKSTAQLVYTTHWTVSNTDQYCYVQSMAQILYNKHGTASKADQDCYVQCTAQLVYTTHGSVSNTDQYSYVQSTVQMLYTTHGTFSNTYQSCYVLSTAQLVYTTSGMV
jgi:hypothetical protein